MRYWINMPGSNFYPGFIHWRIKQYDPGIVTVQEADHCDVVVTWRPETVREFAGKKPVIFLKNPDSEGIEPMTGVYIYHDTCDRDLGRFLKTVTVGVS